MVGEESLLSYHRPPLSEKYLEGKKKSHELLIMPRTIYEKAEIELLLGTRAESIDRESKTVQLDDGDNLPYERLALVTGARPRKILLSGCEKEGVFYLRTVADARRIRRHVAPGKSAVIIGGGKLTLRRRVFAGSSVRIMRYPGSGQTNMTSSCKSQA